MPVCLVTGGAGFIGSRLVQSLVARRHTVRVLDDLSTGALDNLGPNWKHVQVLPGSLKDLDFVRQAMAGVELVFHEAGPSPVAWGEGDGGTAARSALLETLHVLIAAREARVRRVIYASSCTVYGPAQAAPVPEDRRAEPLSAYAAAKLEGERCCVAFTRNYGLETVCLRYFNVFGPGQPPGSPYSQVLIQALEAMRAGRSPVLPEEGVSAQDFIYVDDVVYATLLAADTPRVAGRAYNIGSGLARTGLEIVDAINGVLGTSITAAHTGAAPADELRHIADGFRAEVDLGFCPSVDLEQGLRLWLPAQRPPCGSRVDAPAGGLPPRHQADRGGPEAGGKKPTPSGSAS